MDFDPANPICVMVNGGFVKSEKWLRYLRQASMRKTYYKSRVCLWKLRENEDIEERVVRDPIGINPKQLILDILCFVVIFRYVVSALTKQESIFVRMVFFF